MTVEAVGSPLPRDAIPAGNTYPKYATRNPIARRLMAGFLSSFDALVAASGAKRALEVGCGEGHLSARLSAAGLDVEACDLSPDVIEEASRLHRGAGAPRFSVRSIFELEPERHAAPLIVCCEVLEHVDRPEEALDSLARCAQGEVVLSVPREPLWCLLNIARGKYLEDWGNTPGHIQHWSQREFLRFVERRFEVLELRAPLPWTMVRAKAKA